MLGGHEGNRGKPWAGAVCPGLPACVAAHSPTSFRTVVTVRLSQQKQPRHCHGTDEIDDGRHICGLLVRAWYQALCQNAAENAIAPQRPVGTGAVCNLDRTCSFCLSRRCCIPAAGSRWPVTCWRPTCSGR
jgi:hypothetical protein